MKLGHHTIVVRNPGTTNSDYGNTTQLDWAEEARTDTTVHGCSVQPEPAPEDTVDRDNVSTRWAVWAPRSTLDGAPVPVTALSRILWNGAEYDVDGDPADWQFPHLDHLVIKIRRSTG